MTAFPMPMAPEFLFRIRRLYELANKCVYPRRFSEVNTIEVVKVSGSGVQYSTIAETEGCSREAITCPRCPEWLLLHSR